MCVNYTPTRNEVWLREHFEVAANLDLAGGAEVFPGGTTPLIRPLRAGGFECVSARFGLIPAWSKDRAIARHTYNARAETAHDKPSFRAAWRAGRIGLVPMDTFFEPNWESGQAERWQVRRNDQAPMAVAALWEEWRDPDQGDCEISCTLLTVAAGMHPLLSRFHRPAEEKRSVVPLAPEQWPHWWASTADRRQSCLVLPAPGTLVADPAPRPSGPRRARSTPTVAVPGPPAGAAGDGQGSLF